MSTPRHALAQHLGINVDQVGSGSWDNIHTVQDGMYLVLTRREAVVAATKKLERILYLIPAWSLITHTSIPPTEENMLTLGDVQEMLNTRANPVLYALLEDPDQLATNLFDQWEWRGEALAMDGEERIETVDGYDWYIYLLDA